MPKPTIISIPQPCHEKWDEMTPTERGRFCGACQKTVTDFTTMTDGEILEIFRRVGNNQPCGRYRVSQLNRPLVAAPKFGTWTHVARKAAAVILLLQSAVVAVAQQKTQPRIYKTATTRLPASRAGGDYVLHGRLVDSVTGKGVAGIPLRIPGTELHTKTKAGGHFRLVLPKGFSAPVVMAEITATYNLANYQYDNNILSWEELVAGKEMIIVRMTMSTTDSTVVMPEEEDTLTGFRFEDPPNEKQHTPKKDTTRQVPPAQK